MAADLQGRLVSECLPPSYRGALIVVEELGEQARPERLDCCEEKLMKTLGNRSARGSFVCVFVLACWLDVVMSVCLCLCVCVC